MTSKFQLFIKNMADILDGSDSDDEVKLKINKSYAERYDHWRGKEEVQKFTARYGEEALAKLEDSDGDSSTSTEEDEDAKEITPQLEKQFFKALSCLKKKDPKIYDARTRFFDKKDSEEQIAANPEKKKKDKALFLRDYERKILLERGGQLSSDEEDNFTNNRVPSPTFIQEQQEIQQSFKKALKDSSDESEQEDGIGGLFRPRQKTKEEKVKEDEDYREWLIGRKTELKDGEDVEDLGYLKSYWTDPKLDEGEAYLRDYIVNKRYLDADDDGDGDPKTRNDSDNNFSDDERTEEQIEQFEHKYNFRFEEPDQEFVKRYPRTMTGSLRHQDDRRKIHREEVKERKEKEKEAKRQELKQLKAIKRKEIAERLEKLKQITGNTDINFEQDDLNEDFDPKKHDQRMEKLFNEEFYQGEEDEEKPEFPDLDEELEIENWEEYKPENTGEFETSSYEPHCDDPDFNMDCDYDPRAALQEEMMASQQPRNKKNRKRSVLAQALAKEKPKFDPSKQEVEKYMDEYYGLDYEDVIGDLPCRFKYRNVVPNNYGLTIEEILMADDKELNRWCSLKKTCQYRPEATEWYDVQAYTKKGRLEELKRKILPSLYKQEEEENANSEEETEQKKKRKKKKKNRETGSSHSAKNIESTVKSEESGDKIEDTSEENEQTFKPADMKASKAASEGTGTSVKAKKRKVEESDSTEEVNEMIVNSPNKKKKKIENNVEISHENTKQDTTLPVVQKSSHKQSSKKKKSKTRKEKSFSNKQPPKAKKQQEYGGTGNQTRKKNKKNGDSGQSTNGGMPISDSRLKAYGINPKKYKNKIKYGKKV